MRVHTDINLFLSEAAPAATDRLCRQSPVTDGPRPGNRNALVGRRVR
jgi:hypothetical protein